MQNCWRHPFLPHEEPADWILMSPQLESTFLINTIMGAPLCAAVWVDWIQCTTTVLEEPTQKASENEKAPQSAKCLLLAQCQTSETPLGWVNRKLCMFLGMFSGAPLLDQGSKVWFRGKGIRRCQCWHSGGGTDHTDEVRKIRPIVISSIPPLFVLETENLKQEGTKWTH